MARAVRKRKRVARCLLLDFGVAVGNSPAAGALASAAEAEDIEGAEAAFEALIAHTRARAKERMRKAWGWDIDNDAPVKNCDWKWERTSDSEAPQFYKTNCASPRLSPQAPPAWEALGEFGRKLHVDEEDVVDCIGELDPISPADVASGAKVLECPPTPRKAPPPHKLAVL